MRIRLLLLLAAALLPGAFAARASLPSASAAIPFAPPLTPDELTRLHNVTAWDIESTYSQTQTATGGGSVNVTFNTFPPQTVTGWSLNHADELTYSAAATTGPCSLVNSFYPIYQCAGDVTLPAQFDETAYSRHQKDDTQFSDGCTTDGINFGPKLVSFTDDWSRSHDFLGAEITQLYNGMVIDYRTNPPRASNGPQFSAQYGQRTFVYGSCGPFPSPPEVFDAPSSSLCACAGANDGDDQFRIENGRFVIHGTSDNTTTYAVAGFQNTQVPLVMHTHSEWVVTEHVDKPLTLDYIDLKEPAYPGDALGAVPPEGVVDGNHLSIMASVHNHTTDPQTVDVVFLDDETGLPLPGATITGTLAAGEVQPVTYIWDTEGEAWSSGAAHVDHRIKAIVRQNATDIDSKLKPVKIIPKPVILVHGFVSSAATWGTYAGFLHGVNPAWRAYAVGDGQAPGVMNTGSLLYPLAPTNTIDDNALILSGYLADVRTQLHAAHVDLVVHSMGGLISRDYIQAYMPLSSDAHPVVAHLLMLGTPNRGTNCAIPGLYVPILMPALQQLSNPYVDLIFNNQVTDRRGVPFSVLAGVHFPVSCLAPLVSDPVVTETSARYIYSDVEDLDIMHTDMTSSQFVFDFFVKPRLTGVVAPPAPLTALRAGVRPFVATAVVTPPDGAPPQLILAQTAVVPATSTLDVPIAVGTGTALSIVIIAPPSLTTTLADPLAAPVALTFDGGGGFPLRSYHVDAPASGAWTLHLDNPTAGPLTAAMAVMLAGGTTSLTLQHTAPAGDGSVALTGTLTDGGTPVTGAAVTATLTGADGAHGPVTLLDDGLHSDGASGDGVYGGGSGPLAAGLYGILLHATATGIDQSTTGSVGTPPAPTGCTTDDDCDGVVNAGDNCPANANAGQTNTDAANTAANRPGADTVGDACDDDSDGDGYLNAQEIALGKNPASYCSIMRADVDGDGQVSILDLAKVAVYFTQTAPPAPERYKQDADNQISILDLTRMAQVFTQPVSACP